MKDRKCEQCGQTIHSENTKVILCFACQGQDRQKELDAIEPIPTDHPAGKARPVLLEDDLNSHRSDWLHDPPIGQKIETGFEMMGSDD